MVVTLVGASEGAGFFLLDLFDLLDFVFGPRAGPKYEDNAGLGLFAGAVKVFFCALVRG